MLLVSPPSALMPFHPDLTLDALDMVIAGDCDDIAPADALRTLVPSWNADAKLVLIEGADHFFSSHIQGLMRCIDGWLTDAG